MPRYRVTFLLETPLAANADVSFDFRGHAIVMLFSRRVDLHFTYVRIVVEAQTWAKAIEAAEELIMPALDVISLNRKVPMMLHPAVEVLKAEHGARRRAFLLDIRNAEHPVLLDGVLITDIKAALQRDAAFNQSSVRLLRYRFRPVTVLERFVFSWLAFENMMGTTTLTPLCPHCQKETSPRPAINRDAGFELLHTANPQLTKQQFDEMYKRWWDKLRNPVFHGGKIVTSSMRQKMQEAMQAFVPPMEAKSQSDMAFAHAYPGNAPNDGLIQVHCQHFIEFNSASASEFADDVPTPQQVSQEPYEQRNPPFDLVGPEEFANW
jgi:hypothetical protein